MWLWFAVDMAVGRAVSLNACAWMWMWMWMWCAVMLMWLRLWRWLWLFDVLMVVDVVAGVLW